MNTDGLPPRTLPRAPLGASAGVNLDALRGHNAALVLDLLRTAGEEGISRLELAERTGLTPQAVSKITARLRGEGLAVEAGRRASTGGKPRTVLRLVAGAGHALGLHLDRDELRAVLTDLAGTVVAARRTPLDLGAGADTVLAVAAREVDALLRQGRGAYEGAGATQGQGLGLGQAEGEGGGDYAYIAQGVYERAAGAGEYGAGGGVRTVLGAGVAVPGPLDHTDGVLHRVTGFPQWDGFPLRDALAERLGLPVVVDKDTNAAALGLALDGAAGPGHRSFAYLHLGTGLGAGLVLGGALHRGTRTGAGEFGHQVIQLDGPRCDCGNHGCIEALCLAAVARGTDRGLDEAARVLGEGAGNLVSLLDIDAVLLGGRTVGAAEERFVRGVDRVLRERARREGGGPPIPVRAAPGGATLVVEGAAQLILAPVFGRGKVVFPAHRT